MKDKTCGILLCLPTLTILSLVTTFPLIYAVFLSLHDYRLAAANPQVVWFGLTNYVNLIYDSRFWHSLWITVRYVIASVSLQVVIGLSIALLLNRSFRIQGMVRVMFILPMVIAPVVVGLVFKTLLMAPMFGFINWALGFLGIGPIQWLTSLKWALPSVIFIHTWQWTPWAMMVLLANLQSLPAEPYEAAIVDGAGKRQIFWYITLPLLRPAIVIVIIFRTIIGLRAFAALFSATRGGPGTATETTNLYAYRTSFSYLNFGYGSTLAVVLFIITLFVTLGFLRVRRAGVA